MSNTELRAAKRNIPAYDSDNDIGFVARARFAMLENRVGDLTADEQVQLQRCTFCDDQVRSGRFFNDRLLRNFMMSKYGYTWDTANRDIQNTKQLFNSSFSNKDYLRDVLTEDALKTAVKAENAGNFDAKVKFMALAAKMQGLLDKVVEKVSNTKLQNFQITLRFDPVAVGFKKIEDKDREAILAKYKTKRDITKRMAEDAEDAVIDE